MSFRNSSCVICMFLLSRYRPVRLPEPPPFPARRSRPLSPLSPLHFQSETRRILDIVTHSLYTEREIFLRGARAPAITSGSPLAVLLP